MNKYDLVTILGHTAGGKTSVATNLAYHINSEIISADSRQVYRGMDIGTGKDIAEYIVNNKPIPYHLIDILNPGEQYSVFDFQKDFLDVYNNINNKGKIPIMCGGTGLYLEAILKQYNLFEVPENLELRGKIKEKSLEELVEILKTYKNLHNTADTRSKDSAIRAIEIEDYYKTNPDKKNSFPEIKSLNIGINFDRNSRRKRISIRLKQRLDEEGMLDEVKNLINNKVPVEKLISYGLEYKYLTEHILGKISYNEMFSKLETAIHQFAKRQMTWFRRMEKRGIKIHWIDGYTPLNEKIMIILDKLQ